ncbi:TolB family protein [Krasilnikovia sp. MM14-A1259]|uniref:TolB family protein n=1 Tax=Krasilnikovia sp. MM14-A1259 TaxID=3373539 RepID=UPI0038285B83
MLTAAMTGLAAPAPAAQAAPPAATLVSVSTQGAMANRDVDFPSVSADGRYVAFQAWATNLVPGDTNDHYDVFVRDTVAGTTTLASVGPDGVQGNAYSGQPSISADGRYVAFQSGASNLVAGDTNDYSDIFVRDVVAGTTERVSVPTTPTGIGGADHRPVISADGRRVAFVSYAQDMVPGITFWGPKLFVRDLDAGTTTLASVGVSGEPVPTAYMQADEVAIGMSGDGRTVAFVSDRDGVATNDDETSDILVRNLDTGVTVNASLSSTGQQVDNPADYAARRSRIALSRDGRKVAFASRSAQLVPGDADTKSDIFVRDLDGGTLTRVTAGTNESWNPTFSADGQSLTYTTEVYGGPLTHRLTSSVWRDLRSGDATVLCNAVKPFDDWGDCRDVTVTADGRAVVYVSAQEPITKTDGDHFPLQMFLRRKTA